MKEFVLGFVFDDDLSKVCLILKDRPSWQVGRLNGIGGHVEPNEAPSNAMVREFLEETGVSTRITDWAHTLTFHRPYAQVYIFAARNSDFLYQAKTHERESVGVFPIEKQGSSHYSEQTLPDVPELIALCINYLTDTKNNPD